MLQLEIVWLGYFCCRCFDWDVLLNNRSNFVEFTLKGFESLEGNARRAGDELEEAGA